MKPRWTIEHDTAGVMKGTFSGSLTSKYIEELQRCFTAMNKDKSLQIVIDNPPAIDLCFLQMLWMLILDIKKNGNHVDVQMDLNESNQGLLTKCGFKQLLTKKQSPDIYEQNNSHC